MLWQLSVYMASHLRYTGHIVTTVTGYMITADSADASLGHNLDKKRGAGQW